MTATDRLRSILAGFPAVRLAVLFGSAARGSDRPGSDVDLGVWLEEDDPSQLWAIDVAAAGALGRTVGLVDLRRAPPLLRRFEIAREGLPVVERGEDAWVRFKARAMLDWWDWAPYARRFHRLTAAATDPWIRTESGRSIDLEATCCEVPRRDRRVRRSLTGAVPSAREPMPQM